MPPAPDPSLPESRQGDAPAAPPPGTTVAHVGQTQEVAAPAGPAADVPPGDTSDGIPRATLSWVPELAEQRTDRAAAAPPVPLPCPAGYEILGELGRGGMGVVYKARQVALKRVVALKMILAGPHAGPSQIARFRTEAEAVARLQHPGIVQIFEIGEHDGLPYCALEYVEGGSLSARIARRPLSPAEAAAHAEALARAMHYAHQHQVLHRDLKPANVLLTADGTPKVTDFGLAKQLDEDAGQTQSGQIMGTPAYMAPEQAEGGAASLTQAADVYSLGAILYEMLTGRPPFRGKNLVAVLEMVRTEQPRPVRQVEPGVPVDLETICHTCLQKEPERRYRSALALAQDLERFRAGEPILARPEGKLRALRRKLRRHRVPVVAGLVVAVALLGAVLLGLGARRAREAASLAGEVEAALDPPAWTPQHADAVDALIDRLAPLNGERASALREKLQARYRQALLGVLEQPRLEADDVSHFEANVAALARRDPSVEADLRARLAQRLRAWETLLDLGPPFAGRERAFAPGDLVVAPAGLRAREEKGKPAPMERTVVTAIPCGGDVHWEATFDAGWESGAEVGVVLNLTAGHTGMVPTMAFSPDSRLLVSGGHDRTLRIWDVQGSTLRATLREDGPVEGLAFTPDGRLVAAVSTVNHLAVWDALQGQRRQTVRLPVHLLAVAASPDGRWLTVAGDKGFIRLLRADTLEPAGDLKGHTRVVRKLAFSTDSKTLVTGSDDGTVRAWDVATRSARTFVADLGHPAEALALAPDGTTLAACARGTMHTWDLNSGTLKVKREGLAGVLTFSPDGRTLLVGGTPWDLARAQARPHLGGWPTASAWSPDAGRIATHDGSGRLSLYDGQREQLVASLGGTAYDLVLSASQRAATPPSSLGAARRRGERGWLQIRRNGVVQQQQAVPLPAGPLTVRASRAGDRVTVQVNGLAPLVFLDPSPLAVQENVGALRWPAGAALTRLVVRRQGAARRPSPLEEGDELFRTGRFEEALKRFEEQGPGNQEARYKAGVCLLRLGRSDEGSARLEPLAGETGERWPLLAAVQMWILRLRAKQTDEAEAVFNALGARYDRRDLLRLLPLEMREAVLESYPPSSSNLVFLDVVRVIGRLESLDRVADLLQIEETEPARWCSIRFRLLRAYAMDGRTDSALALARTTLDRMEARPESERPASGQIFADYVWLLTGAGKAKEALAELEHRGPSVVGPAEGKKSVNLALWRARVHWALGDLAAAEAAADEVIRAAAEMTARRDPFAYWVHAPGYMMKGLIRERRGDGAGAQAAWRAGTVKAWAEKVGADVAARRGLNPQNVRDDLAMSAWTGSGSDGELKEKLDALVATLSGASLPAQISRTIRIPPEAVRQMWLSRRGREVARQCAFYEIPYKEYVRRPVLLVGVASIRAMARPEMSDEEEELVWKMLLDCQELYSAGKLPLPRIAQLGLAWKGTLNFFGWGSVAPALPQGVRGPMAYVMGFRYEKLGRPKDARALFETARKAAPAGSPLARLAQAQLDRLK
jgi:WD40 repeat protein